MSVAESLEKLVGLLTPVDLPAEGDEQPKKGVPEDKIKEGADEFKAVLAALQAGAETEDAVKIKCLKCIGESGAYFESAVKDCFKDCMKVVVDILSTTEEQLIELAAVEAISGLGMKATELESKKAEFVTREAVDLILQIAMDTERKEVVQKAAQNQFDKMVMKSDFKAVATKLVHWLSDDREDDDAEHLARERHYALDKLQRLVRKNFAEKWTEEVFTHFFKFLSIVMPTITVNEYTRLINMLASIPQVAASNNSNLIDLVLGAKYVKADADRVVEMLVILGNILPKSVRHEGLVKKLQPEISKISAAEGPKNTILAKAALVAARAATDEEAEKLIPEVLAALKKVTNDFNAESLPANLTAADTLIVALHTLGHKSILPVVDAMKSEESKKCFTYIADTLTEKEKLLVFAVKKKMQEKKAGDEDKLMLGTVRNLIANSKATASETLLAQPLLSTGAEKKTSFPHIKKSVGGPQQNNGNSNGSNNGKNSRINNAGSNKYRGPQKRNR